MINRNKNFRSMLLRRTRLSKSLSIDNTGLNWWLTWKRIQIQLGVWIFFVDSSQTPQRQSSTTSSTAMRLQQFSSKTAKVPKAVFYSGLHYICLVKSVNFCVPSPQILFCVLLVIKTHALSFHLFKNGQKSWVKLNRNGEAWGDLQPNYSYFHKRTKLCTFPM